MLPKSFYTLVDQHDNEGMSPKGGIPLMGLLINTLFFTITINLGEGVVSHV